MCFLYLHLLDVVVSFFELSRLMILKSPTNIMI
nr:MAG TPA: hypothetical protein [Caudoviricetes sp.]